jgi:hypothetical protein
VFECFQIDLFLSMDLPIACTLTEAELEQRREAIMDAFRRMQATITELPEGYVFICAATSKALMQVTQLVDMERQCCPFLTFNIVVDAATAPIRLEVTGPKDAKAVIAEFFNFANTV